MEKYYNLYVTNS